jgi:predicted nucleic acid-binding Zn ribbon protein
VGFVRQRRSPSQHFCSHECRHAMERVWERERHWQRTRAG